MKKQFAYKVVSVRPNGTLGSLISADSVPYVPRQWTRPERLAKHKFLFVCRTRAKARALHKENIGIRSEIWRCEIINPTTKRPGKDGEYLGRPFDIREKIAGNRPYWPEGTLFVDAVKLLYKTH